MQIHELKRRTKNRSSRQIGRGGKRGTTSGRGTKGQIARAGRKTRPELRDIIKKIPKRRGRGKNSNLPIDLKPATVTLMVLERNFAAQETVTPFVLLERKIVRPAAGRLPAVKILAGGRLNKPLVIKGCAVSSGAKEQIIKVGGSVV